MESYGSEYDYYEEPLIQTTYLSEYDEEFNNKTPLGDGQPITFKIPAVPNLYRDSNNCRLEIKCKITGPDGGNLTAQQHVGPVNNLLGSLFDQVTMELNYVSITEPNTLYYLRSYLETLTNYGKEVLSTRMLCAGWNKDTAGHLDTVDPESEVNSGLHNRAERYTTSRVVTLSGPLHLDLFHQEKLIPGIVPINIQLIRSSNSFLLLNAAPTQNNPQQNYKVEITEAKLFMRTMQVSPSLSLAHQEMFKNGKNMKLNYSRVRMKKHNIPTGSHSLDVHDMFEGQLPDRILICFIRDEALTGSYVLNPFNLENLNINFLQLRVNGDKIPKEAYQPDFANNDYISAYQTMLAHLGYDNGNNMIDLTPYEWANGYTIFAFKLTPGPIGLVRTPQRTGTCNLEAKFRQATTYNVSLIVLAQFPGTIEIDRNGYPILT